MAALLILLLTCPASTGVLDDKVPREKAKKPKLKPLAYVPPPFIVVSASIQIHFGSRSYSWIQLHSVILISELPEVTHKVYLDVVVSHPEPVRGRITLGLFGKALPRTVQKF